MLLNVARESGNVGFHWPRPHGYVFLPAIVSRNYKTDRIPAIGYPMAKNLRAKLPKNDTLVVHDVNTKATASFANEVGQQGVHVAADVREVAEKSVRHSLPDIQPSSLL